MAAEATFSICLFLVYKHLWRSIEYTESGREANSVYLPARVWEQTIKTSSDITPLVMAFV